MSAAIYYGKNQVAYTMMEIHLILGKAQVNNGMKKRFILQLNEVPLADQARFLSQVNRLTWCVILEEGPLFLLQFFGPDTDRTFHYIIALVFVMNVVHWSFLRHILISTGFALTPIQTVALWLCSCLIGISALMVVLTGIAKKYSKLMGHIWSQYNYTAIL